MSLTSRLAGLPRWVWYLLAVVWALVCSAACTGLWALSNDHDTSKVFWGSWALAVAIQWVQLGWQDWRRTRSARH